MDRTADEILDDLNEEGTLPTEKEIVALCVESIAGEYATEKMEAFEKALTRAGWAVVDMTNDDDGVVFELMPPEPA